jgi:predicted MFS family arabinose efflux permease
VLGVPAGLELARLGGWRMPFFAVAARGVSVISATASLLPPLTGHLIISQKTPGTFVALVSRPVVVLSWLNTAVMMVAGFVLIPNISAYFQFNLGLPRNQLGLIYMAGGAAGLIAAQGGGRLVDRFGSFRVTLAGTLLLVSVIEAGFRHEPALLAPIGIFPLFVFAMGLRNVSHNTLTSRVPGPAERARFTSLQSAVQHFASAGGAFLSSALLTEDAGHKLFGMRTVTGVSIGLSLCVPVLLFGVERLLQQREGSRSQPSAPRISARTTDGVDPVSRRNAR